MLCVLTFTLLSLAVEMDGVSCVKEFVVYGTKGTTSMGFTRSPHGCVVAAIYKDKSKIMLP